MKGKGAEQVEAELKKSGKSEEEINKIKPHKVTQINLGNSSNIYEELIETIFIYVLDPSLNRTNVQLHKLQLNY
jgi:hypothetical protein